MRKQYDWSVPCDSCHECLANCSVVLDKNDTQDRSNLYLFFRRLTLIGWSSPLWQRLGGVEGERGSE